MVLTPVHLALISPIQLANSYLAQRDHVAALGKMLDHQVSIGGGYKGLVGGEVVGQGVAAATIELGKDVIEEEEGSQVTGGLDDFELDDFEGQDGGANFAAGGNIRGWMAVKQNCHVFSVRTVAGEAARPVIGQAGFQFFE